MNYLLTFMTWLMIDIATNPFITIFKFLCIALIVMSVLEFVKGRF